MIKCYTRKEMLFDGLTIPRFTKATILLDTADALKLHGNATGEQIAIGINKQDFPVKNKSHRYDFIQGSIIGTFTSEIYILYDENHDPRCKHIPKRLLSSIPEGITIGDELFVNYRAGETIPIGVLIDAIENWFREWISANCEKRKVTKALLREFSHLDEGVLGGWILTDKGTIQYEGMRDDFMVWLGETSGYTYEFKGGMWFD